MKREKQFERMMWSEQYASGLVYLDNHRRNFIDIINELVEVVNERNCENMLPMVFYRLAFYVEDYFTKKEIAIKDCKDLPLVNYKAEHDRFTTAIKRFHEEFRHGNVDVCDELLVFLIEWFENYVKIFDAEGAAKMRELGFE